MRASVANPVAFGEEGHQLFGWYHPPAIRGGATRDCVVVMSNPLGYDAICAHGHYRVLAQQLAEAGFAVLRYDHHGTGDSSGSDEDPERLQAWINGIACAVEFGKRCSGVSRASLFGVRMGGTLALAAASAFHLVDSIVAWSPFPSGLLYLREMRALQMMRDVDVGAPSVVHDSGADIGEEAAGYLLTASTITALGMLSPVTAITVPAASVLLLARDDIPESDKLARHLGDLGCGLTHRKVPGYAGMMRDTFDSVVPLVAFAEIRSWLEALHPIQPAAYASPISVTASLVAGTRGAETTLRETPVSFGPGGKLFGILSKPLCLEGERLRTGVVFVSVGSNVHVGPNRMYVTQARALASLGFVTLRMDIGGVGESPPGPGQRENHLYGMHSVADVKVAIQFLRDQHGIERIILVGVCSGAYLSFHAAVADQDTAGIVLINPQTFTWREGDSLQLRTRRSIRAIGFYRRHIFDASTWQRLMTGHISAWLIISGVIATLRKRFGLRFSDLFQRDVASGVPRPQPDVENAFRRLLQRGVNTFLVYSAADGGLNEMEAHLGRDASALRNYANFNLQIVDGADHTFTPLWAQRRLLDLITQHMIRLYG